MISEKIIELVGLAPVEQQVLARAGRVVNLSAEDWFECAAYAEGQGDFAAASAFFKYALLTEAGLLDP